uniref:Uncharacterized protein n=1 Tax=Timema poppense TaxID=170557 RepID=A0A7R9HCV8_TIMPO|nr:unnamed protein product [Timema poppensis]
MYVIGVLEARRSRERVNKPVFMGIESILKRNLVPETKANNNAFETSAPGRNFPNHKPLIATKPLEDFVENKLNAMQKEIQEERHGRWKAEQSVAQLRDVMENNKAAIQEMIQSKRLALEMAKQLREKYTVVREARTQALAQLDALKEENGCLLAKLAQEKQERSKLLDQMTVRHVETERIHQKKREQLTEEIQKLSEDNGTMKEKVKYLQDKVAEAEKRLIDRQEEITQEMDKRLTLSILESDARFRVEQRSLQDELEKKTKQYEDMESRCHSLERKLKKAQDEDNKK